MEILGMKILSREELIETREYLGLTAQEVGDAICVSKQCISYSETHKCQDYIRVILSYYYRDYTIRYADILKKMDETGITRDSIDKLKENGISTKSYGAIRRQLFRKFIKEKEA